MKRQNFRLYFIDVMRAFAILMMLQGHFVDGLLDPAYRDSNNILYSTWIYFRGITAPTFFTVTGFIFMYLLIGEETLTGWKNPRVKKGIRRGIMLIGLGYLLRLSFSGLFAGRIYESFYMVDVLQCIGLSILLLTGIYLFSHKRKTYMMPVVLLLCGIFIFILQPLYAGLSFDFLPKIPANFFTTANGSVFTIIPWFGYAAFGAFAAMGFHYYKTYRYLYHVAIGMSFSVGLALMLLSSSFFLSIYEAFHIETVLLVAKNNYLFIRLGNVLVLFSFFMLLRHVITSNTIRTIGKNTLSIYVIHFIILYGSFTGVGLYKFFHHTLNPYIVIPGALLFMILVSYLSFQYHRIKPVAMVKIQAVKRESLLIVRHTYIQVMPAINRLKLKIMTWLGMVRH